MPRRDKLRGLAFAFLLAAPLGLAVCSGPRSLVINEPDQARVLNLEQLMPVVRKSVNQYELADLRRARDMMYRLSYDTTGAVTGLELKEVRGTTPPAETEAKLRKLMRANLKVSVPKSYKKSALAPERRVLLVLPVKRL